MPPTTHPSSELVDLLMLGGLSPEQEQATRAHLSLCPPCQKRLDEVQAQKQAFEQFVFPRTADSVVSRVTRGWSLEARPLLIAAALVVSVALAAVVLGGLGDFAR